MKESRMNKSIVVALLAGAATLASVPAHAAHVSWSVGINLPVPAVVVSEPVPVYAPAPVYAPEPVYYQRQPVYAPEPVYYSPRPPVYVRPVPVAYPRYYYRAWHHEHDHYRDHHDHDHDRWEGRGWRRD
jgi:hypothetical protein